jgi:hypothetical protein
VLLFYDFYKQSQIYRLKSDDITSNKNKPFNAKRKIWREEKYEFNGEQSAQIYTADIHSFLFIKFCSALCFPNYIRKNIQFINVKELSSTAEKN